jgi:hypothetical protein
MNRLTVRASCALALVVVLALSATACGSDPSSNTGTSATSGSGTSESVSTFTMPDLVGGTLQVAQDKLEALGSTDLSQLDAWGLGRTQTPASDWQVCVQVPGVGAQVAVDDSVTLFSALVKEDCE